MRSTCCIHALPAVVLAAVLIGPQVRGADIRSLAVDDKRGTLVAKAAVIAGYHLEPGIVSPSTPDACTRL